MAYSIEIQHLDGEWYSAGKLATFEGGVWVYPTFATKADAEAAIAATYGDVTAGSARIVSDDLNDRILAARAAGDWDLHAKLWDERCAAEVDSDEMQLATNSPFVLSIEPVDGPAYRHGYHLGTIEQIARKEAETRFRGLGHKVRTVALLRDGHVFDVFDGHWHSELLDMLDDEDTNVWSPRANAAH